MSNHELQTGQTGEIDDRTRRLAGQDHINILEAWVPESRLQEIINSPVNGANDAG